MNLVLNRFHKLKVIYNIIGKEINNSYYRLILDNKTETDESVNKHTLTALASAKEKIIELENEINNATPKTEDA